MTSVSAAPVPSTAPPMPAGMDPAYYSLSLLRRRKLDECVAVSTYHLNRNLKAAVAAAAAGALPPGLPAPSPSSPNATSTSTAASATAGMDEQLWCIQTKAIVLQSWFDDTEIEDDGVDDVLLEGEQAVVSTAHRPNTSLRAARQGTGGTAARLGSRAGLGGTSSGRPVSSRYGFARPGTLNNRPGTLQGRGCTAVRPITGRFVRIGTASLMAVPGGPHINVQRLNLEKYAREKPMVAKLLCDYLFYVEHRPKLALELCTAALKPPPTPQQQQQQVVAAGPRGLPGGPGLPPMRPASSLTNAPSSSPVQYREQAGIPAQQDWWWKERLAKANYQLGLLREAEKHFKASLHDRTSGAGGIGGGGGGIGAIPGPFAPASSPHATPATTGGAAASTSRVSVSSQRGSRFANYHTGTVMELGKVYNKMDQPLTALELYADALDVNPVDHHILLCCARLHDELHQTDKSFEAYQQVLRLDSSNVEAIACIAAHFFYERNQPELALRFYRRLLQMGVGTTENWNNIGLCAFYSTQLDFALSCFERALALCKEDAQRADVWYNIGHIGIGIGDSKLAERAFKLAMAADATHAEAINNLGVLAMEREKELADGKRREGRRRVESAVLAAPELVEALYNTALTAFEAGELEQANNLVVKTLVVLPNHAESIALQGKLREQFLAL